eukprot:m.164854 g.164854  ORF g.164854 m.164854 type:complete len:181 (-) comp13429_c3_seq2:276-818(-)
MGRKIVLTGSGGVGKSCLVLRYLYDRFVEEYDPTIEESYSARVDVDGKTVPIELVDTAGQEEFKSFRDATMDFGEAFIVVFAVTDKDTFKEAQALLERVERHFVDQETMPILLVGNKNDLVDRRKVTKEEAEAYCNKRGITYIETSAKNNVSVKDVFEFVIRIIRKGGKRGGKKKKCIIM